MGIGFHYISLGVLPYCMFCASMLSVMIHMQVKESEDYSGAMDYFWFEGNLNDFCT